MHGLLLGVDKPRRIVADYNKTTKKSVNSLLGAYPIHPFPVKAVVRGLHMVRGKAALGNRHHNHIKKVQKASAINVLSATSVPNYIKDFEDLFEWVYRVLSANGIIKDRCLWVYDMALRIGQSLNPIIEPKKYVYLYAGALKGAKMLGGITISRNKAPLSAFPRILQQEGALHIENIMCDYSH